jgi:transposase InsO family protein
VLETITKTRQRSKWTIAQIIKRLGLTKGLFYSWRRRGQTGQLADQKAEYERWNTILPEERTAVVDYALEHPQDGYKRLAWMMVDEDVAYLSPSSVYNVLSERDLLYRYKRSEQSPGTYNFKPQQPHDQWHVDIMYLYVRGNWFFFVAIIDAYSRYVVNWDLLLDMTSREVNLVIQQALEKYPGFNPIMVSDHGTQFTGKDFKALIKQFALKEIKIRLKHPESNGISERFYGLTRQEGLEHRSPADYYEAKDILGEWIDRYNHRRLHSALNYLRPVDYFTGEPEKLLTIRRQKLSKARERRIAINKAKIYNEEASGLGNRTLIPGAVCPVYA